MRSPSVDAVATVARPRCLHKPYICTRRPLTAGPLLRLQEVPRRAASTLARRTVSASSCRVRFVFAMTTASTGTTVAHVACAIPASHSARVIAYATWPSSSPGIRSAGSGWNSRTKRIPAFSITRHEAWFAYIAVA